MFVRLDVADEASWQEAVSTTINRFGKLDVLVNNAGIFSPLKVEDTSVELWDSMMAINAKGVFLGTKHAIPEMRKARGGSIVSSGPHHQDSGEAKIRESTAGVSRKPSSDGKARGSSSKHLWGLTAWNT